MHLRLTLTRPSHQPMRRSGYTLRILRKQRNADWVLARDANLLTPD